MHKLLYDMFFLMILTDTDSSFLTVVVASGRQECHYSIGLPSTQEAATAPLPAARAKPDSTEEQGDRHHQLPLPP